MDLLVVVLTAIFVSAIIASMNSKPLSLLDKEESLKKIFNTLSSSEEKYIKIIELGQALPSFAAEEKKTDNLVEGCQSTMYLVAQMESGKIFFSIDSEALISKGLGALLIFIYNGESPETILKYPPSFLTDLGIQASLSPGRSNGLASLYLNMKQRAVKNLIAV